MHGDQQSQPIKRHDGRFIAACPHCRCNNFVEEHVLPEADGRHIYTERQKKLRCAEPTCKKVVAWYNRSGIWTKIGAVKDD